MNNITNQLTYFLLLSFFATSLGYSQNEDLWTEESSSSLLLFQKNAKITQLKKEKIYRLDIDQLKNILKGSKSAKSTKKSILEIPFPNKQGELKNYTITEVSTLAPELQEKYPNIKSYIGVSKDTYKTTIRFSLSNLGLHSMKLRENGNTEFIDPYTKDALTYKVYDKSDIDFDNMNYECKVVDESMAIAKSQKNEMQKLSSNDGKSRLFRLALSCTGEYAEYHLADQGIPASATETVKKEAVLSAMNISMTRINGVFEKELALTMQLLANNDDLIFLDPDTDGYTSDDDFKMLDEVQAKCDAIIGSSNYDMGHLFSTGFSGLAELSSPCTSKKAQGISGRTPAKGDSFDIDFVAHEMGHQFGATHTFNNSCGSNISLNTSVEPGSGSTIMGYAGICSPNVQDQSDDYFHGISLSQMYTNIVFGNSTCGQESNITEVAPTADAGLNYTIPASTPFVLTGSGTSGTGSLHYTWEQMDKEKTTMPPVATSDSGPLFRSTEGSTSPLRYFPAIETVLSGNSGTTWEQLPTVTRNLKFRLTARDNGSPYGQFDTSDMNISAENTNKSFEVTSHTSAQTLYAGESTNVTWEVADTNLAPINTDFVNILISTDGGYTYPIAVASNVLNNGSHNIIIPQVATSTARFKVESVDNIFYNINTADITIETSKFIMNLASNSIKACAPDNAIYEFEYNTYQGFNETTTFSVNNLPEGTIASFSPETATVDGTMVALTISNTSSDLVGAYQPLLTGTATTETNSVDLSLTIDTEITTVPYLQEPQNNIHSLGTDIEFTWTTETEFNSNSIEIATDLEFTNIIESATTDLKKHTANNLEEDSTYFWRVRETNSCNTGSNSQIYKFSTGKVEEFNFTNNTTTPIPDNSPEGISSEINITDNILISEVFIKVDITHPYVGDLEIYITNPDNEKVILVSNSDIEGDDYDNTQFNDNATISIIQGSPPYTGSYKPIESLSLFSNKQSTGIWTLTVSDNAADDEGALNNWKITINGIDQNSLSSGNFPEDDSPAPVKGFSPNGDGINDYWTIENINTTNFENENHPQANVRVFNIQGQTVFSSKNYKNDWDGTGNNGSKLPIGTYIYEIRFSDSKYKTQKGWLYIKY